MEKLETDNIKLAVLEEKVFNMVEVISKLDDTIEKLSDLSVNVSKMLAVHEEKLDFARESAAETAKEIALLEAKMQRKDEDLHTRLRSVEKRVWIVVGVGVCLGALLQSGSVLTTLELQERPAIIEVDPNP